MINKENAQYIAAASIAFAKPKSKVTLQNIISTYEHYAYLSMAATLVDNGFKGAARFIVESFEFMPDDPLLLAALDQLANQDVAKFFLRIVKRQYNEKGGDESMSLT